MNRLLQFCGWAFCVLALLGAPSAAQAQTGTLKQAAREAKVSTDLLAVITNGGIGQQAPVNGVQRVNLFMTNGNSIAIDAVANSEGEGQALLQALQGLGLSKGIVSKQRVSGYLPMDKLGELKNVGVLRFARPSYKPMKNVGAVTSQGDVAMRADMARATYSVSGAGIKVGVLSDSYNNKGGAPAGVASGDLPAGVQVLADLGDGSGSDEGRAMIELIHDVAPGSPQAFHTAFEGDLDFAQGIRDLAAAGCKIITDDVFYFAEPFFQDGPIAQAIDEVVGNGIPYFSAAGNSARKSYQSAYAPTSFSGLPTGYDNAHNFGGGDRFQSLTLAAGQEILISFQWDDPFFSVSGGPGAQTDMDVLVYVGGAFLGAADSPNIGGDAVEVFSIFNPGPGSVAIDLVLAKWDGPDPTLIKWVNFGSTVPVEYDTKSSTSVGHNNSARGIGTGAAPWFRTPAFDGALTTAIIENFSSAGGTPILFNTAGARLGSPIIRQKPDITSVDGTNTTFFGSDIAQDADAFPNFFGTSAAAPHAAAVAALMMEKVPSITPATLLSTLKSTALDMDDPFTAGFDTGFDFGTGFGFIQADRALQAISNTAPVATANANQTATVGVPFSYTVNAFTDAETPSSLTYTASIVPANNLTFDPGTRVISGTPSMSGVSTVTVTATDPGSLTASTSFTITVQPASGTPPPSGTFSITSVATLSCEVISPGERRVTYNPQYAGVNGQPISFRAVNESVATTAPGPYVLRLYTDNPVIILEAVQSGVVANFAYSWLTACSGPPAGNTPPTVANPVPPQSATVGVAYTLSLANVFTDAETPSSLVLSVSALPAGLSFSPPSTISGTPSMSGVSTVTVTATDPGGLMASNSFNITVQPASGTPPPSGTFSITSVATLSCEVISPGERRVTYNPQYAGVNGQPISFRAVNESVATTAPGPYVLRLYTDNPVIILEAVQSGVVANFAYSWLTACSGGSPRLAASEPGTRLRASILPNPVNEEFTVQLEGAQGQTVRLALSDLNGRAVINTAVDVAAPVHKATLRFNHQGMGLYLLRVSMGQETLTLKVIRE